jgi:hypothetical protein
MNKEAKASQGGTTENERRYSVSVSPAIADRLINNPLPPFIKGEFLNEGK